MEPKLYECLLPGTEDSLARARDESLLGVVILLEIEDVRLLQSVM